MKADDAAAAISRRVPSDESDDDAAGAAPAEPQDAPFDAGPALEEPLLAKELTPSAPLFEDVCSPSAPLFDEKGRRDAG